MTTVSPNACPVQERPSRSGDADRASAMLAALRSLCADHDDASARASALLRELAAGHDAVAGALTLGAEGQEFDLLTEGGPEGVAAWHQELGAAALDARSHGYGVGRVFGADASRPELVVLSAPIETISGEAIGGVALLLAWQGEAHAQAAQDRLRSAAVIAASAFHRPTASRSKLEMDDFARVLARAGSYRTLQEFAFALTNAAKQRFGCDQASLGLAERQGVRVACISGLDHVKHRSPGVHHIQQAMGECLDARTPLIAQPKEQWSQGHSVATGMLHERWRSACSGSCVLSVPLMVDDEVVAVLSLTRHGEDPFRPEDVEALTTLVGPLAAALPVVRKSTRSLSGHARGSLVEGYRWLTKPGTLPRQAALLATTALVLWLLFKPTMYRVTTPASIIAGREVVIASGLDATVSEVLVRSGDRVARGDVLLRLDASSLYAQRAHLSSELEAARLRLNHALAQSDPASASVAQAERDMHAARLARIEEQISMSSVTSPIEGIVTTTDPSRLAGRLVPVGEPLLVIADEGTLQLELELPERRVTDLASGARVRFASHARPEDAAIVELTHIDPAATIRDGRPVFLAQAELPPDQRWLRPGMEGVAMLDAGRTPNVWLGLRRVIDFAHLRFWIE